MTIYIYTKKKYVHDIVYMCFKKYMQKRHANLNINQ
jgi:hypothetical protein